MKELIYSVLTIALVTLASNNVDAQDYSEASLGFDPGEFELIESAFPRDLRPLFIPRFRGVLRLGTPNSYGLSANPRPLDVYRSQKERGDLLRKKEESVLKVFQLMEMEYCKSDIKLEELAREFQPTIAPRTPVNDPSRTILLWSGALKEMAPKYLKPETLSKYWCKEGENCIQPANGSGAYVHPKKNRPTWGGGRDEFTRLRAWQAYVKTEVPKLQKWANQINEWEAFIVGTTYIQDYDFNHEGFVIRVDAVEPKALKSTLISYPEIREPDSFFTRSEVNGKSLAGKLIKMSPEKAEKLVETMEAYNPGNRQVYFVYKAKINFERPSDPKGLYGSAPTQLIQEPASNIVEFFLDEQLKLKLFEADFSK